MTDREEADQIPDPPDFTKRRKPLAELAGVGPDEREKMARFADALREGYEREAQQIAHLQAVGQDFPGAAHRAMYDRCAISLLKQVAWLVRTGRGGPLGGGPRRTKKDLPS